MIRREIDSDLAHQSLKLMVLIVKMYERAAAAAAAPTSQDTSPRGLEMLEGDEVEMIRRRKS